MLWQQQSLEQFLNALASDLPTPGGGGAGALAGALAAALASMMANLTLGRPKFAAVEDQMRLLAGELEEARGELLKLIDEDAKAYGLVVQAYKLPKGTGLEQILRQESIAKAAQVAALVPLKICENMAKVEELSLRVVQIGNPMLLTDGGCAAILAMGSLEAAELNVLVNLPLTHNQEFIDDCRLKLANYKKIVQTCKNQVLELVKTSLKF